ncbi:MAG: hypothetical protein E3J72_09600 [Planctomycetota bacterium]|nr:MAG: hypothetical protein E3J72_09600 [Planctomycetota bacterium]
MKPGLPLKLGIVVIALFGVVIAGMFSYEPLRYKWLESRLQSDNDATRKKAINILISDGTKAVPHIRRWLVSEKEALMEGAIIALAGTGYDNLRPALPEIETACSNPVLENSAELDALMQVIITGLAEGGGDSLPVCRRWLRLKNDKLITSACKALTQTKNKNWINAKPELEKILDAPLSPATHAAASVLYKHGFDWRNEYSGKYTIRRNILCHILRYSEDENKRYSAAVKLAEKADEIALGEIIAYIQNATGLDKRIRSMNSRGRLGHRMTRASSLFGALERKGGPRTLVLLVEELTKNRASKDTRSKIIEVLKRTYSRMPDFCPEFDPDAKEEIQKKQAEKVRKWYERYKDRLKWDAAWGRYRFKYINE